MPRPRMNRRIGHQPPVRFYKPQGIPLGQLRGVTLTLDGLEAIRLADAEGLDHEKAAARMGISRPTFSRLLAEARGIVARGLVNGWAIRIDGGNYTLTEAETPVAPSWGRCRRGRDFEMTSPKSATAENVCTHPGEGQRTHPARSEAITGLPADSSRTDD
ncbi:MAG: DUF134 domain-containing protein [Deltaproteobacteria bacterium]|nr:DUF134 domain-containing protein [Deltaproteobacteria bacterium]